MSTRKQFQSKLKVTPELDRLIEEARAKELSEEDLREQRVASRSGTHHKIQI